MGTQSAQNVTKNHSNSCKYSQRSRKTSTHSICSTNSSRSQPLTFQTSLSSNAFKPLRSSELKRKSKLRKSASCTLKRSVKPKASMKMSLPTTESPCTCPLLKLRQRDLRADCTWRPQQSTQPHKLPLLARARIAWTTVAAKLTTYKFKVRAMERQAASCRNGR